MCIRHARHSNPTPIRIYHQHSQVPFTTSKDTAISRAVLNSFMGKAQPNPQRVLAFHNLVPLLKPCSYLSVRDIMRMLGMMASCITIVPQARLHMRPLQQCLAKQWSQAEGQLEDLVLIKASTHRSLQWWTNKNLLAGRPFWDPVPQITLTDASLGGWEAYLGNRIIHGLWTPLQKADHISYLELLDIQLALKAFLTIVQGHVVLIRTENITAM